MEKVVQLNCVSKEYPLKGVKALNAAMRNFPVLKDISLDIFAGEIFGIIGRNGAGKSTFLNIVAGILSPTKGDISVKGRVLGLFNLGVGFQDELSGRDNIFLNAAILGAQDSEVKRKLSAIIEFSELGEFIDMPLGTYSQGMRLRLGFSIIANLDFDTLVIDEVMAVGDVLFQNKCFQRLMDFKRSGKTLIITNQSPDLIERLCDRALLLDHGEVKFTGNAQETVNLYRKLLSEEKFFVGPSVRGVSLVRNTKKWAEDVSGWGQSLGTKEGRITAVEFLNKFGRNCNRIKTGESLKVRVSLDVRNKIKELHFGVAIFREDGAYCYGPNTEFDGYKIQEVNPGKGYFTLVYRNIFLAPGNYRVSLAIWDKNETLSFDYHNGYYKLEVAGDNPEGALLNIPFKFSSGISCFLPKKNARIRYQGLLNDDGFSPDAIESVTLFNSRADEKALFVTNEPVGVNINLLENVSLNKNHYLWVGIYREDGVFCQGFNIAAKKRKRFTIYFPEFPLLPGGYKISSGIWDCQSQKFLNLRRGIATFYMASRFFDHGTVYLRHNWSWRFKHAS